MASTTTSAADGKDYAARQHAFAQQLQDEVASRAYTGAVMSAGMDLFVYCAAEKFKHDKSQWELALRRQGKHQPPPAQLATLKPNVTPRTVPKTA
jgi:hypothetical protein